MARLRNAAGVIVNTSDDIATRLGLGWEPVEGSSSTGPAAEGYAALTVPELKDEIRKRNEDGRDDDSRLALSGTKDELIASLEADD